MNLYGKITMLRAVEPEDMPLFREMTNDPETEWLVEGWSFPISVFEQEKWYRNVIHDKTNLRFTIVERELGQPIGMVNLIDVDWKNRTAFHGIKLSSTIPKRRGFGFDAVMTIMQYAFEELQLERLDGAWVEYNTASIKLYEKCGWCIEGTKRKAVFKRGQHFDIHFGGILREEFKEAKKRLNW